MRSKYMGDSREGKFLWPVVVVQYFVINPYSYLKKKTLLGLNSKCCRQKIMKG